MLQLRPLTSEPITPVSSAARAILSSLSSKQVRRPPGRHRPGFLLFIISLLLAAFLFRKPRDRVTPKVHSREFNSNNDTLFSTYDKPVFRPNTVLVVATYGGVGNQLYFLLEALVLARRAHLDVVIPTLPPRDFGPYVAMSTAESAGDAFWDVSSLARAVEPQGRVLRSLPASCAGRFDVVYVARRSFPLVKPPPNPTTTSRAKQAACFLVSDYDWGDGSPPKTERECAKRVFKDAAIVRRYLPLSLPADEHFVDELRNMREQPVLPSGWTDPGRPACVMVDGHSFNMAGKEGHEYLYSFMHYVEPARKIVDMVADWNVDELAVLHLRYDEKECVPSAKTKGKVCIRVLLAIGQSDTVYWAPLGELVDAVVKAMVLHEARTVYIAASPYVPKATVTALRAEFKKRVHVSPLVRSSWSHNEQNFVERELAVRSKCFIGDFASTWSGTVYYKRRTRSAKTLWSNVLLGKSRGLGYYEDDNPIPLPDVFENSFASIV